MIKSLVILGLILSFSIPIYSQLYLSEIQTKAEFDSLCGAPLARKYANVYAVKIVFDLKTDSLYYINAKKYKNHYEFCKMELNYVEGIGNFLDRNYSTGDKRKYLLANINFFQSTNNYVLEISPLDLMTTEQIIRMYKLVKESFVSHSNIRLLTNSPRLQENTNVLNQQIETISPFEIYGNLSFQAISKYQNTGVLRVVDDENIDNLQINSNDILVLKTIPNYLPAVAGLIVTEFQTPLSHISILGLNRKIPICAYPDVFKDKNIAKLNRKQVSLKVTTDTFYIELDTSKLVRKKRRKIELVQDLSVDSLIDVEDLFAVSSPYVGSKAANFGALYHLSKSADFKTPEAAFAIPFYFYAQHIQGSRVRKLINNLIENRPSNPKELKKKLRKIQNLIEKKTVEKSLISAVEEKIEADGRFTKFRFRSSTNAEDIKGFSGAGLYTSKTGKLESKKKPIDDAIRKVWASVWSYQAFIEREYYNIDHRDVAMGILVHRSFPNESVNGVAITKNIYRRNSNGFLINAQVGELSVVKPDSGVVCDQFVCFPSNSNKIYKNKTVIDVITYSSITQTRLVMTEKEIQHLANQLAIIKKHFAGENVNTWTYIRIGYDIEFKLDGHNRQLYIKQIRPYND